MRLNELAGAGGDKAVTGFALDHRKVAPGNLFGAFKGARFNGEDFIAEAAQRGEQPPRLAAAREIVRRGTHLGPDQARRRVRHTHRRGGRSGIGVDLSDEGRLEAGGQVEVVAGERRHSDGGGHGQG